MIHIWWYFRNVFLSPNSLGSSQQTTHDQPSAKQITSHKVHVSCGESCLRSNCLRTRQIGPIWVLSGAYILSSIMNANDDLISTFLKKLRFCGCTKCLVFSLWSLVTASLPLWSTLVWFLVSGYFSLWCQLSTLVTRYRFSPTLVHFGFVSCFRLFATLVVSTLVFPLWSLDGCIEIRPCFVMVWSV